MTSAYRSRSRRPSCNLAGVDLGVVLIGVGGSVILAERALHHAGQHVGCVLRVDLRRGVFIIRINRPVLLGDELLDAGVVPHLTLILNRCVAARHILDRDAIGQRSESGRRVVIIRVGQRREIQLSEIGKSRRVADLVKQLDRDRVDRARERLADCHIADVLTVGV